MALATATPEIRCVAFVVFEAVTTPVMPATATNPSVDAIDRDLAELRHRRVEAREQGDWAREVVLTAAIHRKLKDRYQLTNGR